MRASSMEWELDIFLTEEEKAAILKYQTLKGQIIRNAQDGFQDRIPLQIERGETSEQNDCIDIHTTPERVYWRNATAYRLVVSDLACSELEERSATGERDYGNPACTIQIRVKNKDKLF